MSRQTPGPWVVDLENKPLSSPQQLEIWTTPNNRGGIRMIARVFQSEADANLIAAAPEMLEVLKWVDRSGLLSVEAHRKVFAIVSKADGK